MGPELSDRVCFSYLTRSGNEKSFAGFFVEILYSLVYLSFKHI